MAKVKLTDICDIQYGYAFDSMCFTEDDGYLPLIRIRDVKRGYSETFYSGKYSDEYVVHAGDLLVGMDGEFNIARWKSIDALLNQRVCKLISKQGTNAEYLRFAMTKALKNVEDRTAFVTVKHLSAKELNKLELNIPLLEEQNFRANKLLKLEKIIALRENELQKLNDLIKARFVEMFGDTKFNNKEWNTLKLTELLERGSSVSYGIVQTGETVEEGIPVFRPIDITGGHIPRRKELKNTSKEISDKYKRTLLKGYELLITVRGSIGETFQVTQEFMGCNVGRNIVPLRFDTEKVLYKYMEHFFAQMGTKDILAMMTKGIALQGLNMSEFKEMVVIVPPIEMQREFIKFANQIDKSKVAVQKALAETQTLFDSLMQKYFG